VKLPGAFDADAWYAAFRAGRVFVTNGPMLDFTINGAGMGQEVRVARGARLDVAAVAQLNPDIDTLGRLELIVHGDVAASERGSGGDRLELKQTLTAERSMWVAVRALGARQVEPNGQVTTLGAVAHSAPIYVVVDDQPFWKTSAVADLVKEQRQLLQDLVTGPVDPMGDLEAWETVDVLARQWERQRFLLGPRVEEADRRYRDVLNRATGTSNSVARRGLEGFGLAGLMATCYCLVRLRTRPQTPPERH
jgi:hypothetical protein